MRQKALLDRGTYPVQKILTLAAEGIYLRTIFSRSSAPPPPLTSAHDVSTCSAAQLGRVPARCG